MHLRIINAVLIAAFVITQGCSPAGGEERGHEFMPDMVHSTAYDANLYDYYFYNTWGTEEEYKQFVIPRLPVTGTVARGHVATSLELSPEGAVRSLDRFSGLNSETGIAYTANGSVPYYYDDTEEERTRAIAEILDNPLPITAHGLETGKKLYTIYCGICHGDKADGLGYLVREADPAKGIVEGVYPAAPANFMQQEFYDASNGRYYHAIMHGKNVMGPHADKLSYVERWEVIHFIRSLQAKQQGLTYNEDENTFTHGTPGAMLTMDDDTHENHDAEHEHGEEGNHGDDHDDHAGH